MLHVLNLCITHQIEKNVWWINYRSRYLARLSKGWLYQLKKNICDIHVKEKSQLFFIQYTLTCQASSILYVYTVHPQYGLSSPWKRSSYVNSKHVQNKLHESSCSPFLQQFYENNSFLGMEKYWYNLECYGFPMLHYISSDILQLPYVHPSANIKWLEQSYHQFYLIY